MYNSGSLSLPLRKGRSPRRKGKMEDDDYVDINIDDIEDPREVIPDKHYVARIKSVAKKHKAGSEYPYLDVRMTPEEHQRKTLFLTLSFHPNALWNMKDFVLKSGVDWPRGKGFNYKDLIGRNVGVTVGTEPDQNDPKEKRNVVGPPYSKV
jgi:hypothetical protein